MAIVGGLDVHRRQITFDWLDSESGEVRRGRIPGDRLGFRAWLDQLEQRPADWVALRGRRAGAGGYGGPLGGAG
jgi:hypothetical protein